MATLGIAFRVRSSVYRPGGAFPEKRFRFQFFSESYGTVPTSTSRKIFPNEVLTTPGIFLPLHSTVYRPEGAFPEKLYHS